MTQPQSILNDTLLSAKQLAALLGKTPVALAYWRYQGIGPRYITVFRKALYRASDVDKWLAECATGNQSTAPVSTGRDNKEA